jgi:hypothetical protein
MKTHWSGYVLVLCLFGLMIGADAYASGGASPDDFVGNWVMKVGARNFIVLKLKSEGGRLTGTLSRPKHFSVGDGNRFSEISSEAGTGVVVRASIEEGHLHIVVQNPADKTDEDEFELALTGNDQASLKYVGTPFDPWTILRVKGASEPEVATDWDAKRVYMLEEETDTPNAEMAKIYEEDQKVRQSPKTITKEDWVVIDKSDAERREVTRKLLAAGQLHTGKDFTEAAFIFQHGGTPEDYLLGHTLAVIAVAKGEMGATWIAAATLDRYLQSIAQPQIYGTQFVTKSMPATQEPYNRDLISDALRLQLGVPTLSVQLEQLKDYSTPATKAP